MQQSQNCVSFFCVAMEMSLGNCFDLEPLSLQSPPTLQPLPKDFHTISCALAHYNKLGASEASVRTDARPSACIMRETPALICNLSPSPRQLLLLSTLKN